jgi:hypothetical protein
MPLIEFGSKVKITKYKDHSMIGRIGIVKKIGIHPDTSCIVKVDDVLLKFRGLKNLKVFEKKEFNINLEDMSDKEVLSKIVSILIEMVKNK